MGQPNIRSVVTLDLQQRRTLTWAGLAVVLAAFDGSVLVLALPAIASDFHARTPALSNLGSVLAIGALGALPLAALADRFGRRRLIAIGVAGVSPGHFSHGPPPPPHEPAGPRAGDASVLEPVRRGAAPLLLWEARP